MGIEPTPAVVVVFRAHATRTMRYFPILFFGCWVMCCCYMGGVILCVPFRTPPMKNYESKDIIAYGQVEPSGLHHCHRKRNGVVFKGKGITNKERRAAADDNCLAMVCAVTVRGLRKSRYHLFAPGSGIVRPHPGKTQKDQGRSC